MHEPEPDRPVRARRGTVTMDDVLRKNYKRTIREIDDIEVNPNSCRVQSIRQLADQPIKPVTKHSRGLALTKLVMSIDLMYGDLWDAGEDAEVDDMDLKALESVKRALILVFVNSPAAAFRELLQFYQHNQSYRQRYETIAFNGLLNLLQIQSLNRSRQVYFMDLQFSNFVPCTELAAEDIIPRELLDQRPVELLAIDLRTCYIQLETRSRQLKLVYVSSRRRASDPPPLRGVGCTVENLLVYADLLLMAAARLTTQTWTAREFSGLDVDYALDLGNGQYKATDVMREDILWTITPFIREMYRQKTTFRTIGNPLQIPIEDVKILDKFICDYAQQNDLLSPMHDLRKLYPKLVIGASEPRRYARRQRIAVMDDWSIITECRGTDQKGILISHLAKSPWKFLRQKLQPRNIRDALLAHICNSYINNRSVGLNFISKFVVFNSKLETEVSPKDYLDQMKRPLVVQSYNHFNFYHEQTLYVYNRFSSALIHWLHVLLSPPYNGYYDGIAIRPIVQGLPLDQLSFSFL